MNAFVIGHVGRFTNQKNHSKLIDIFAAIKERKSDAYLLLLGGGELQDTIKSKVEKLNLCDSVIFCGVRTDVNKDDYNNFKSYLICAGGALAVSEIYSWMKNISNRSTTVSRLKHD